MIYFFASSLLLILFSSTSAQLQSSAVSDGACMQNISQFLSTNISDWINTPRDYYGPMASQSAFRSYAELFLGRPANDMNELNQLQLRFKLVSPPLPLWQTRAFEATGNTGYFYQFCPPYPGNTAGNQDFCVPVPFLTPMMTNVLGYLTSIDSIVYTDNMSAILFVRCLDGYRRDFLVLTVGPTIDPTANTTITNILMNMGFDPMNIAYQSYPASIMG